VDKSILVYEDVKMCKRDVVPRVETIISWYLVTCNILKLSFL